VNEEFPDSQNLSLYYWLRRRIGKESASRAANTVEKIILIDINIFSIFFLISFWMIAGLILFWFFLVSFEMI